MISGSERKEGFTVNITAAPRGIVTLTTTETVPTKGWLQKRIAAICGQESPVLFRETTEITEYPSIQSLKKAVSREKILKTAQQVVGWTGALLIGMPLVAAGILGMAEGADTITVGLVIVIGGISIVTGSNFGFTGVEEYMKLRSISNKVNTLFPN